MHISIATVFPNLYDNFLNTSLIKRAQENKLVFFEVIGFSSLCAPKERIDEPTVGPGPGMAIRPEVLERVVASCETKRGLAFKIIFTPQGKKLDQDLIKNIYHNIATKYQHIMLIAGRYEGFDDRAQCEYADLEISIGDYVLMGGDLPAMVFLEAFLRYIPGIIGNSASVTHDSYTGPFFDYPSYTVLPHVWLGHEVPSVLRSGNHSLIDNFRKQESVRRTVRNNFQWVKSHLVEVDDKTLVLQSIPAHYVVLMHDDVILNKDLQVGTSSVTSLDIHDIARSAKTYGLKNYFLVTSLLDQQKIVNTFLQFWETAGIDYNKNRSEAVEIVRLKSSLHDVINDIKLQEGINPILIATSAKFYQHEKRITYYDQEYVWQQNRPVLFILGTARGLSDKILQQADFLLLPLEGMSQFKHLSVRSAAAIIFDRWLGVNRKKLD